MLTFTSIAVAQERPVVIRLSLEEALARAEGTNESLEIASAGVQRARGEELRARSEYYPQIGGSASYTRIFSSEFGDFGGDGGGARPPSPGEPCGPFVPDTMQPLPSRVDSLESAVSCLSREATIGIEDLRDIFGGGGPFGRGNRLDLGLTLNYPLYTGGRRTARTRIAEAGRRSAEIEVLARSAQLTFDVTRAYFDAVLADRLVGIAAEALAQAERALGVTLVAVEAGDQAEFDALRARVARDNQRASLVQRLAERDIAFARLRTLVGLPVDQPLVLTTELGDAIPGAVARRSPDPEGPDTVAALRSTVRQAEEEVRIREAQLRIARSQRLPNVTLSGQFGQVAFPTTIIPSPSNFTTVSSISVAAEIPIFTGGRLRGDRVVAEADLREARARFDQLLDLAEEEAYSTHARLDAARAAFTATGATIVEASRAYEIAELRYREGIASLLELADTRLLLEEALANRAVAARDLQVARTRLMLLPDLPLEVQAGLVPGILPGGAAIPGTSGALFPAGTAGRTRLPSTLTSPVTGGGVSAPRPGTTQRTVPDSVPVPGRPGGGGEESRS